LCGPNSSAVQRTTPGGRLTLRERHSEDVTIRAATAHDAPAIARVHVETWRSAYQGIVSDTYLARLSPAERADQWRDFLSDSTGLRFLLAAHDERDELIGFAAAGPECSDAPNYLGELYALYVLPSHQRRGFGHQLVQAVGRRLVAAGTNSLLLWVLEANTPAREFYEGLGGIVVRGQLIDIGGVPFTEVAYGWSDLQVLRNAAGM
jgi:ribosomal protein S18 acetylase RimI-like enzyme